MYPLLKIIINYYNWLTDIFSFVKKDMSSFAGASIERAGSEPGAVKQDVSKTAACTPIQMHIISTIHQNFREPLCAGGAVTVK
jgi:hypothetical protein